MEIEIIFDRIATSPRPVETITELREKITPELVELMNRISGSLAAREDLAAAIEVNGWGLKALEVLDAPGLRAHTFFNRAQFLLLAGQAEDATSWLDEAEKIYEKSRAWPDLLDSGALRLKILEAKGANTAEIVAAAQSALAMLARLEGEPLTAAYGSGLLGIGQVLRRRNETRWSRLCFEGLRELAEAERDPRLEAEACGNLADIWSEEGDLDRAAELYRQAIQLDRLCGNTELEALGLANLAHVCYQRGDLEGAADCYAESLKLRERVGFFTDLAVDLRRFYHVCHYLGRYREALQLFQRYHRLTAASGSPLGEAAALFNPLGYPLGLDERGQSLGGPGFSVMPIKGKVPLRLGTESGELRFSEFSDRPLPDVRSAPIPELVEAAHVSLLRGRYKEALGLLDAAIARDRHAVEQTALASLPELPMPPPGPLGPLEPSELLAGESTDLLIEHGRRLLGAACRPGAAKDLAEIRQQTAHYGVFPTRESLLHDAQRLLVRGYERARIAGDAFEVAVILGLLGKVFRESGEAETGLLCFMRSVPLVRRFGEARDVANTIGLIGALAASQLGQPRRWIEAELVALEMLPAASLPVDRLKHLHNLGGAWAMAGSLEKAVANYAEALELVGASGQTTLEIRILHNLAATCLELQRWKEALAYAASVVDRSDRAEYLKASALAMMGTAHGSLGNLEQARACCSEALLIAEGDPTLEYLIYHARARIYAEAGQLAAAEEDASRLVALGRVQRAPLNEGRGLALLGQILCRQGRWSEAVQCLERGIRVLRDASDPQSLLAGLCALSEAYWGLGAAGKARQACLDAIAMVSMLRRDLRDTFHKEALLEKHIDVFEGHLRAAMALAASQPESREALWREALEVVELAKSRVFVDLVGTAEVSATTPEGEELLDRKWMAESRVAPLGQDDWRPTGDGRTEEAAADVKKYRNLLKQVDPDALMATSIGAYRWEELAQRLGPEDGFLLYIRTSRKYIVFAGTAAGILDSPAELEADCIDQAAGEILRAIGAPETSEMRSLSPPRVRDLAVPRQETSDEALAQAFVKLVPSSWLEELRKVGISRLLVVPDGRLVGIPFHILCEPGTDGYLIDQFPLGIAYVPSLTSFALVRDRAKERGYGDGVVFANPNADDPLLALPGTELEVTRVRKVFARASYFTGQEVTLQTLAEVARSATIIYFAGHGILVPGDPLGASLVLHDGLLSARDLLARQVRFRNARLVVLSCCHLGNASLDGREVMGFTRALFHAGTPSVVAAMWAVLDQVAAELMPAFCANVVENGMDCAQALRQATLAIRHGNWRHPAYWGPFGLWGAY